MVDGENLGREFWSAEEKHVVAKLEPNKAIQEWLVENLTDWLDSLYDSMRRWVDKINEAETVEDIMMYKKSMLVEYVNSMPIGINECYFCLLYQADDCEEVPCEYGVVHGFCNDEGSDYEEIRKLREKLKQRIEERYYRGESFAVEEVAVNPDTH